MLYLGVDKVYDNIEHHNIIFAEDYKANVDDISNHTFDDGNFSFYVQNPSHIDKTLAPEGHSAVYILVPITNNKAGVDWDEIKDNFADKVIDAAEKRGDMPT